MDSRHEQAPHRPAVEKLEDRLLFAHANPTGTPVQLPPAATNGAQGITVALEAPASHARKVIIMDF